MNLILIVLGIIIFANGAFVCVFSNFNLGTVLTLLAGVFFFVCGVCFGKIQIITKTGIPKAVKYIVLFMILAEFVLIGFIAAFGMKDNADYTEDAIIVLGAAVRGDKVTYPLQLRLDKALEYSRRNPRAYIVVSGGQGIQETVTEASAMKKYLIENGADESKILAEDKATSTNENMRYSKKILDEKLGKEYRAVVVTNNFHVYRSVMIADIEGISDAAHIHAGLQWYNIIPCYLRESLAVFKMWILG